uniref:Uncharacterized protein n=1 Tax=Arundo donax TaxID=35708 RepID=A0A0A9GL96_ARUDO
MWRAPHVPVMPRPALRSPDSCSGASATRHWPVATTTVWSPNLSAPPLRRLVVRVHGSNGGAGLMLQHPNDLAVTANLSSVYPLRHACSLFDKFPEPNVVTVNHSCHVP